MEIFIITPIDRDNVDDELRYRYCRQQNRSVSTVKNSVFRRKQPARDVRDVAGIAKLDQLPRFPRALAQTAGQMCNSAQLGDQVCVGGDGKTVARYVGFFEQMYLLKHTTTADGDYRLMYYRDADKFEIDVVIENGAGQLVGSRGQSRSHRQGKRLARIIKKLAGLAESQIKMGVLLYDGTETMPLADGI